MKQRSKAELIEHLKTYAAVKRDNARSDSDRIAGGASFWRTGVEWGYVLWKIEKLSTNDIANGIRHVTNEINSLTDSRREEIQEKMKDCDWYLKSKVKKKKCKNQIDQVWNDLDYYNHMTAVDYSLLMCEYLIDNKHYGKKRLNRVLKNVYIVDFKEAPIIFDYRNELYENKGIWIELNENDRLEYFGEGSSKEDMIII